MGVLFPYGLQKTCRKDWMFKWPFPLSNCHGASVFCSTPPWNVLCNLNMVRGVCDESMLKSSEKHGSKRDLFLHVGLPGWLPDCHLDRRKTLAEGRAERSAWEVRLPSLRRGTLTEHQANLPSRTGADSREPWWGGAGYGYSRHWPSWSLRLLHNWH